VAFRRKTFARTASKRRGLETRAHANRAFKRVTRQWWLAFNIKCQVIQTDPGADCPNGGKIILVSQSLLQGASGAALGSNFPDALRIKRIEGNLYFKPINSEIQPTVPQVSCLAGVTDQSNHNVYFRMGLRKAQGPQSQAGVPDALNPLDNGATPFEISDYADGRWMKLWEHLWGSSGSVGAGFNNDFNCCSVQDGYTVPPVVEGSQVTYDVPPVICEPCGDVESPAVNGSCIFTANVHSWWHCRLRYGRTIVLKENDDLSLYYGWERLRDVTDGARLLQPALKIFGGCRLLLES